MFAKLFQILVVLYILFESFGPLSPVGQLVVKSVLPFGPVGLLVPDAPLRPL